jgi:hypothetical protein
MNGLGVLLLGSPFIVSLVFGTIAAAVHAAPAGAVVAACVVKQIFTQEKGGEPCINMEI